MKHVLALRHRTRLLAFAAPSTVLGFDFDGTLAPIAAHRDAARMRPTTRRLFARLCARQPVAVLSGRSRDDLALRLAGVVPALLAGNHGIEPGTGLRRFAAAVAAVRPAVLRHITGLPGVELEDKTYSLTLHCRRAPDPSATLRSLARQLTDLPPRWRVLLGVQVLNLLPPGAPHKGEALRRFCSARRATAALYVGDEDTDEDVFRLRPPPGLLAIRVGRSAHSAAPFFLRDQSEMDELLDLLLRAAPRSPSP